MNTVILRNSILYSFYSFIVTYAICHRLPYFSEIEFTGKKNGRKLIKRIFYRQNKSEERKFSHRLLQYEVSNPRELPEWFKSTGGKPAPVSNNL